MDPRVRDLFDATPINASLGLKLLESGAERSRLTMEPQPELKQEGGRVHGGILATLADTTAVYAIIPSLPAGKMLTSIEFKLNFVRPAHIDGGVLAACGTPLRVGRRIALASVEVSQREKLVATGLFTYLLFDLP